MKGPKNPDRGLVRFQLYETVMRLAEEKFLKSGVVKSYNEAVAKILEDHFLPEFNKYDHHLFRTSRYWNE